MDEWKTYNRIAQMMADPDDIILEVGEAVEVCTWYEELGKAKADLAAANKRIAEMEEALREIAGIRHYDAHVASFAREVAEKALEAQDE